MLGCAQKQVFNRLSPATKDFRKIDPF